MTGGTEDVALEVSDLHVSYGNVRAVRGVGARVLPGRITLVLGANGAGKTTTLRAIAGLLRPERGQVSLRGARIDGLPGHEVVRRGLALVPEGRRVFSSLSVLDNLRAGGHTAPKSLAANLDRVFEMFPILRERRQSAAGYLSGGEQQMLAFGRALMSDPTVVLMDEPTMGLAPVMVDSVLAKVRAIADTGLGVLMVGQSVDSGMELADDMVVISRGEVVFSGTAAQGRASASVVQAVLGESALGGVKAAQDRA